MNIIDDEEQRVNKWMENPVVPRWLKTLYKEPESPNTLHYDEDMKKYVYTPVEGEKLFFEGTAEAHDDSRVDDNNTKLIGDFPDLLKDRSFGQTTVDNRMLFFGTNDQHYKTFLYKIYLCQYSEERYEDKPDNFFRAQKFISSHMLNWRIPERPFRDYWFEDHSHISKVALINGQNHVWQAGTNLLEKTTMKNQEYFAVGGTIEAAIIKLAAEIHEMYNWEGDFRK